MIQSFDTPSPAAALLQLARIKSGLSQGQLSERAGRAGHDDLGVRTIPPGRPTLPTLMRLVEAAGFDLSIHLVSERSP